MGTAIATSPWRRISYRRTWIQQCRPQHAWPSEQPASPGGRYGTTESPSKPSTQQRVERPMEPKRGPSQWLASRTMECATSNSRRVLPTSSIAPHSRLESMGRLLPIPRRCQLTLSKSWCTESWCTDFSRLSAVEASSRAAVVGVPTLVGRALSKFPYRAAA